MDFHVYGLKMKLYQRLCILDTLVPTWSFFPSALTARCIKCPPFTVVQLKRLTLGGVGGGERAGGTMIFSSTHVALRSSVDNYFRHRAALYCVRDMFGLKHFTWASLTRSTRLESPRRRETHPPVCSCPRKAQHLARPWCVPRGCWSTR